MASSPSKSLERYDLLDRIAVGGMAEVFRAKAHGAHGFAKTLAIKRILPELAKDPEFEQRFIAEAVLAVELTHANIVQVLDFGRFGGSLFIAMEFIDGLDLAALLKSCRDRDCRIPVPVCFQIATGIACGLDYAHRSKVVHRDVSPSNILLSKSGDVKLADFGIAMAMAERDSQDGRIMGKWRYMSPEQGRGQPVDTRSDLFSAAAVMFELFTGKRLFPGDTAQEIIDNICNLPIPRIADVRPGLPEGLDGILGGALRRDPRGRTASAAEILRSLSELSYQMSLAATALDVADVVGEALDAGAVSVLAQPKKRVLDDFIRAQLAGADGDNRQTAVGRGAVALADTDVQAAEAEGGDSELDAVDVVADDAGAEESATGGLTLIRRGIDADGVTVWEFDKATVAAGPLALRGERVPAVDEHGGESGGKSASRSSTAIIAALAAVAVAGAAVTWYALGRSGDGGEAAAVDGDQRSADAAPLAEALSPVRIESEPPGARVSVDGLVLASTTPTTTNLSADSAHTVEVALDGYRPWQSAAIQPEPGKSMTLHVPLVALTAALSVTSEPPGATVWLDGVELGKTPLDRRDLAPGTGLALKLTLAEHKPLEEKIDLSAGEPVSIHRELQRAVVWGQVNIHIPGSWAYVWFEGKNRGLTTSPVRLPVGHPRVRLVNSQSGKERTVEVEVVEGKTLTHTIEL